MTDQDTLSRDDAVDRIWSLADSIDFCMFVTWDGERQRARPMSARVRRDAHRIYFLADEAGAKDDQIERFPIVTLVFSDIHAHDYVVITGKARVSDDRARIHHLWSSADKAWWDSEDDPSIRVIEVDPEDAELWDGPGRVVGAAKMLAAALTVAKPTFGENRKVDDL